jgi:periplasmic copper chaperone A
MRFIKITTAAVCCFASVATTSAHVMLETKTAKLGSTLHATFDVGHGCSGSPTTKLRIGIPSGVVAVVAEPKSGWEISTLNGTYDQPYSSHGAPIKEGVIEVDWSGLLPPHEIGKFTLTFDIADSLDSNQRLYFPVVQECGAGVVRWIDKSDDGDHPAPSLLLQAAH